MKKGFRFVIGGIKLAEGQRKSIVTILKLGKFYDPRYDWFEVTQEHFASFTKNFSAKVYGQDLPVDIAHMGDFGGGAAGWFRRLFQEGKRLRAEIEWTDLGVEAVSTRGFKYMSAEYRENYQDNESGTNHGATLLGAALTIRPVVKGLDPVALSSAFGGESEGPVLLHEEIIQQLTEERTMKKGEYIERLKKALAEGGVPEGLRIQLAKGAELIITGNENETEIKGIIDAQVGLGKSLAEEMKKGVTPPSPAPAPAATEKTLSAGDVQKMVADGIASARQAETDAAKQLSDKKAGNVKLLSDTIAAAQGIEEEAKKTLSETLAPTITGFETEEQIKAMVAAQVKLAEGSVSAAKLAAMGFPVAGHVRVAEGDGARGAMQFSEHIDKVMDYEKMAPSQRFPQLGSLRDHNKKLAEKVLKHYDEYYRQELSVEGVKARKLLAGGVTGIADTALPYTVMRTVIREAVYDFVAANIIAIETENGSGIAPQVFIPFVKRQTGNPGLDRLTVFEGQAIPYAGLVQDYELAQTNPRKLAIQLTNEVAFFTRASVINYDAVRDGFALLTRMMGELSESLLLTEMIMAADEYSVVAVVNEDLAAQTDAAKRTFQLAQWPLVKPRKVFDLKGTQVGATVNPLTITYQAAALAEYDGTGAQAAGNYYKVTNYTLGQFQIVNQAGVVQVPAAVDTLTVSYSYTTNVLKFDKNLPANTKFRDHVNDLLDLFGRRAATLYQDRYATPNFAFMTRVMNNMLSEASMFERARERNGQGLTNDGNLAEVKGLPCFGTNVPLPQIGDLRLIIGQRFTSMQKIVKPWSIDPVLKDLVDSTGKFIGKKGTYGEQYDGLHTPSLLKGQYTEVVAYNSTTDIGPFN